METKQNHDELFEVEEPTGAKKSVVFTLVLAVLLAVIVFVVWKNPFSPKIQEGSLVQFSYVMTYPHGDASPARVVELSYGDESIRTELWDVLSTMKESEVETVTLAPSVDRAKYYDPAKLKTMPKVFFDNLGEEVVIGKYYSLGGVEGVAVETVQKDGVDKIVLDTNPLDTWQDIEYTLTLLSVSGE